MHVSKPAVPCIVQVCYYLLERHDNFSDDEGGVVDTEHSDVDGLARAVAIPVCESPDLEVASSTKPPEDPLVLKQFAY